MSQYKVTYWDIRGRAEVIRMLLVLAEKPFEDCRLKDREEWTTKIKPTTKWGQLPMLEFDGKTLTQTYAIARYLAREFGLEGKDNWENAQIDEIAGALNDFYGSLRPWFMEQDPEKKKDIRAKIDATVPPFLNNIQSMIKENKSGWVVGDNMTWIDLEISERVLFYKNEKPEMLEGREELVKLLEKVHNHPKLKDYIAGRNNS